MAAKEEDYDPAPSNLVIGAELSRGAYGSIFWGTLDKNPVAVKRIHPVLLREEGSERLLNVFKNECRYLSSLDHPNVVKFMGAYRDNEGPLLVMELMKESLEEFLKKNKGNLSLRRQLDICNSIAKGLFFLHNCEKPIIHRDLTDRNILLAEDGTVKIADFGQSKLIDKPTKILMTTQQPGAVLYMPPEVLKDNPRYTNTVDTFSLGVLMLETATQQQPQVGLTDIGCKPEVVRRAVDLNRLSDDHLLKPLIIWCLQKSQLRPSASVICNQTTALFANVQELEDLREEVATRKRQEQCLRRQLKESKDVTVGIAQTTELNLDTSFKKQEVDLKEQVAVLQKQIEILIKDNAKLKEENVRLKAKSMVAGPETNGDTHRHVFEEKKDLEGKLTQAMLAESVASDHERIRNPEQEDQTSTLAGHFECDEHLLTIQTSEKEEYQISEDIGTPDCQDLTEYKVRPHKLPHETTNPMYCKYADMDELQRKLMYRRSVLPTEMTQSVDVSDSGRSRTFTLDVQLTTQSEKAKTLPAAVTMSPPGQNPISPPPGQNPISPPQGQNPISPPPVKPKPKKRP